MIRSTTAWWPIWGIIWTRSQDLKVFCHCHTLTDLIRRASTVSHSFALFCVTTMSFSRVKAMIVTRTYWWVKPLFMSLVNSLLWFEISIKLNFCHTKFLTRWLWFNISIKIYFFNNKKVFFSPGGRELRSPWLQASKREVCYSFIAFIFHIHFYVYIHSIQHFELFELFRCCLIPCPFNYLIILLFSAMLKGWTMSMQCLLSPVWRGYTPSRTAIEKKRQGLLSFGAFC